MIKVLFISHSNAIIGGATTSLIHLIRNLPADGCRTRIVCFSRGVAQYLHRHTGVPVSIWRPQETYFGKIAIAWSRLSSFKALVLFGKSLLRFPFSVLEQIRYLRFENPDVIHLNSAILFSTALAGWVLGLPIVWHVREGGYRNMRRWLSGKIMRRLASAVICISPAEKHTLFLDDWDGAHIVFNPIDFDNLNPAGYSLTEQKEKLGFQKENFVVLTLGGSNPRKGIAQIMESLDLLPENVGLLVAGPPLPDRSQSPRMHPVLVLENWLVLAGIKKNYSTRYTQRLAALRAKYPARRIVSIGNVEDVASVIAACDVVVFGGTTPHFARPVYEAWAMKKPVIAFNMPGMEQNISDGVDGLLVKKVTGRGLAQAIKKVMRDPELCRRMGESGHRKALSRMQPEEGAKKVFAIYNEVVKAHSDYYRPVIISDENTI